MEREASRIERRRVATRARILEVAARRFAAEGLDEVRLDAIAEEADVARGTLYSHFATKDELVWAIMEPVLLYATTRVEGLVPLPLPQALDGLFGLYFELFQKYPDALRLVYRVLHRPLGPLAEMHGAFMRGVMGVLEPAAKQGLLRTGDAILAGRTMARVAVPLLELFADRPDAEQLFKESLEGLMLRVDAAESSAQSSPS
jgi:AcrR family transcriptional regulator